LKPEASNVDIAEREEQDEGQRSNRAQAGARRNSSGSLAILAAMRRASSRVSTIPHARQKSASYKAE
jgi:hypothetical protein